MLGKFENEPAFVEELWERYLNGFDDESVYDANETLFSVFKVESEERQAWKLGESIEYIVLWEDSQGRVFHAELSADDYEGWKNEVESAFDE